MDMYREKERVRDREGERERERGIGSVTGYSYLKNKI